MKHHAKTKFTLRVVPREKTPQELEIEAMDKASMERNKENWKQYIGINSNLVENGLRAFIEREQLEMAIRECRNKPQFIGLSDTQIMDKLQEIGKKGIV